jgi:hypothetical protein
VSRPDTPARGDALTLVAPGDGPTPPPAASLPRALAHCALGLVVLSLAAAGLRSLLPLPPDTVASAKLEGLASLIDEVDTLFVGPSLVYRHVDPARFDALTAEAGRPTRSFNLGVSGMGLLEMRWMLGRVAALEPASLDWVFLDPYALGLELPDENRETGRVIAWHDLGTTWDTVALARATEQPTAERTALAENHLVAGFFHWGNIGRLRLLLEERWLGTAATRGGRDSDRQAASLRALGPAGDGFLDLDQALRTATGAELEELRERRSNFVQQKSGSFLNRVKAARRAGPLKAKDLPALDPTTEGVLRDVAAQVEALGARLVLFNGPSLYNLELLLQAHRLGLGEATLRFSDPKTHRKLFVPEERFDARHLNAEGARRYTDALAAAFLAELDDEDAGR